MNNFGPIFAKPVADAAANAAKQAGVSEWGKMNAMWAPLFTANFLINGGYGLYLMFRRGTLRLIVTQGSWGYFLQALFMGIAWPMCLVVYGMGLNRIEDYDRALHRLESYGPYIGYPMFLGAMIVTGNLVGILRGEWRGTSAATRTGDGRGHPRPGGGLRGPRLGQPPAGTVKNVKLLPLLRRAFPVLHWGTLSVLRQLGTGAEITVAFCSAKDAAFAERKATIRHLLIRRS